jgi:arylformamidase
MPTYYDISLPISPVMPVWPGDPLIRIEQVSSLSGDGKLNVSRLEMGTHTLTHVDAPRHIKDRGLTVDRLPLDLLIGPVVVVEPRYEGTLVTATDLGELGIRRGTERLLIKTRNSELWMGGPYEFETDYVSLSKDTGPWLISRGIKLLGVDYLSVDAFNSHKLEVHHTLLEKGVVILEGLNLSQVPEGRYQLICLPLKVRDGDGAPARAVLMR